MATGTYGVKRSSRYGRDTPLSSILRVAIHNFLKENPKRNQNRDLLTCSRFRCPLDQRGSKLRKIIKKKNTDSLVIIKREYIYVLSDNLAVIVQALFSFKLDGAVC